MKKLTLLVLLVILATSLAAQNRFMTFDQNENWLATVKSLDKSRQWTEIEERFFSIDNWNRQYDSIQYAPLIVINGSPLLVPDTLTSDYTENILSLLDANTIDNISIVDRLSEQWILCKPFAGVIILAVDRKTGKKLFKVAD